MIVDRIPLVDQHKKTIENETGIHVCMYIYANIYKYAFI
jgi:hypothetical protein